MCGKFKKFISLAGSGLVVWIMAACVLSIPAVAQQTSSIFCSAGQILENGFCVNKTPGFPPSSPAPCPPGWGPVAFGVQTACVGLPSSIAQTQSLVSTQQNLANQTTST